MSDEQVDIEEVIDFSEVGPSLSASIIRTIVPTAVGLVVSLAAKAGIDADSGDISVALAPLVSTLYYITVRWLEEEVSPKFGMLLGKAATPNY